MASTLLVPPPLPIGNKQTERSSGGGKAVASPSKGEKGGGTGKAGGKGRGKKEKQPRAWADYTPTPSPWMDYTPTPWGGSDAYGFGLGPNADLIPPPPNMSQGLPLHPPPRVAAMAAAAAAAAGAAAAAAAAACDVNAAAAGDPEFGMESPTRMGVKNTFIHMMDQDDRDEFGLPGKSQTMPDMMKKSSTANNQGAKTSKSAGMSSPFKSLNQEEGEEDDEDENGLPTGEVPDDLPSRGSALHGGGKCRPCAWFWKPQGCLNDKECSYCHLCSESELKARKKTKVAAMRMGALMPASKSKSQADQAASSRILKLSPLI